VLNKVYVHLQEEKGFSAGRLQFEVSNARVVAADTGPVVTMFELELAAGVKVSGCTVHFVNNEYDSGPIIVQRAVPVEEGDTPDMLSARVFAQECIAYPEAIRLFAAGRLQIDRNVVHIRLE